MKKCPTCGQIFSLDELLSDPSIVPIGMTSDDEIDPENVYYFTHAVRDCGTTFTVPAALFVSALDEPLPNELMLYGASCPGLCTHIAELRSCQKDCKWAPYRRLLLDMVERRKTASKLA